MWCYEWQLWSAGPALCLARSEVLFFFPALCVDSTREYGLCVCVDACVLAHLSACVILFCFLTLGTVVEELCVCSMLRLVAIPVHSDSIEQVAGGCA